MPRPGKTPGIGGKLPTYRFMRLNRAAIAAWLVVIEYKLHIAAFAVGHQVDHGDHTRNLVY